MSFRYVKWYSILTSLLLLLSIVFVYTIDPYDICRIVSIKGLNAQKPEFSTHLRMSKAWAIRYEKPEAINIGTSRAEYGIDPDHPGWGSGHIYNLALSGANVYECLRYFQHAHCVKPLKKVALPLDFFMFNTYRKNKPDFDENRLAATPDGLPAKFSIANDLLSSFSIDGLIDSFDTICNQEQEDGTTFLPNGQREWTHNARNIRKKGGHRKAFLSNEKSYMTNTWLPAPFRQYNFINPETKSSTFEHYATILKTAYRDHIDLRIFISPSHARQWEALRSVGLWPLFEEWKRKLVDINEKEAAIAKKPHYSLWDFSGYNSLTTEDVPPDGDSETQMKWYWESSHYKKELGDLVLDRIFNYHHPERTVPDDFGVPNPKAVAIDSDRAARIKASMDKIGKPNNNI